MSDVIHRLREWGKFSRDSHGLGYPNCSPEQRAFQGGYGTARDPDWPDQVMDTDEVMLSLKISAPRYYAALYYVYVEGTAESRLAVKMGMSDREARKYLARAEGAVEQALLLV